MKKYILFILLSAAGAAASAQGPGKMPGINPSGANQKAGLQMAAAPAEDSTQVQLYKIQGTQEAFTELLTALDLSRYDHTIVEQLKAWILQQYKKQLQANGKLK